jgi:hypothetical protein
MRLLIILIGCLCLSIDVKAQAVYTDPVTSASIMASSATHNNNLNKTNEQLTLIKKGQLAITGELAVANTIQKNIYEGLTQVSAAAKTIMGVERAAGYVTKIFDNVKKTVQVAQGNPVLLLFAEKNAMEFKKKAIGLSAYISEFALKGGKDNLMDAGERAKMMRYVISELILLNSMSYSMHRSMYYAKQNGILRSLSPWQTWVNRDEKIAKDVIKDFQYIQK